jgi:alanine racemase
MEQVAITYINNDVLGGLSPHICAAMIIDLGAVKHNYAFLSKQLNGAECGAVIKANAYGLGMVPVAKALSEVGCQHFFVATLEEAIDLRKSMPDEAIYPFNGLLPGSESFYSLNNITPVLNDLSQVSAWQNWSKKLGHPLKAILQLDTGMWRAGLSPDEVNIMHQEPERLEGIDLVYIMSHLCCSDEPEHPKNQQQLVAFQKSLKKLPRAPASLANSHGIFLGQEYHFDLARPGRSLYGLGSKSLKARGLRPAVQAFCRITQVRDVQIGETIGYNGSYEVVKPMRVATISSGYADGIMRPLSNKGSVFVNDHPCSILGIISMDMMTIDVSHLPKEACVPGEWVEIIGSHMSADDIAECAQTTSREIMVNLGRRYHRIYLD